MWLDVDAFMQALQGWRDLALRQYRLCAEVLARELDVAPEQVDDYPRGPHQGDGAERRGEDAPPGASFPASTVGKL